MTSYVRGYIVKFVSRHQKDKQTVFQWRVGIARGYSRQSKVFMGSDCLQVNMGQGLGNYRPVYINILYGIALNSLTIYKRNWHRVYAVALEVSEWKIILKSSNTEGFDFAGVPYRILKIKNRHEQGHRTLRVTYNRHNIIILLNLIHYTAHIGNITIKHHIKNT